MNQNSLNDLEAAMLKKRLKVLRTQGATGKSTGYGLGDAFFKQMEDHWTFCSALSDIYAVKEMQDQHRDDEVAATLPSSTEDKLWLDETDDGPTDDEIRADWERLEANDDPQEAIDQFKRLEAEVESEHKLADLRDRWDD